MTENEKDDFWDISKLVPKKSTVLSTFSTKEKSVLITIPDADSEDRFSKEQRTLSLPNMAATQARAEFSYSCERGLIKKVTVKHSPDKYDFHANFLKAALLYYDFKTPECEFARFYSYMPQYTQLTPPQKNYYFYWRSMLRSGKYIKTDYSYFYLYVYEILNLPDKMPKTEALRLLVKLWKEYRKTLPNIDTNMALWVQDFCLVYNLPCPMEDIKDFIFDVMGASGFKEFYLSDAQNMGRDGVSSILAYLSDYDWRRGKYAGGDNKEAYAKHLTGAMGILLEKLFDKGKIYKKEDDTELSVMERTAFRSALCTSEIKYRVSVEYRHISEETELRSIVTSALKYTENKLRMLLGIKSRLAVKEFSDEYKQIIDSYFAELFDKVNRERMLANRPEYERLYEAESVGISVNGADEIERASWNTTARLIVEDDDFEEKSADDAINSFVKEEAIAAHTEERENADSNADSYGLNENEIKFILGAFTSNNDVIMLAAEKCRLPIDALADRINEVFSDNFGDIILEDVEGEYRILEDYREDIEQWLNRQTR